MQGCVRDPSLPELPAEQLGERAKGCREQSGNIYPLLQGHVRAQGLPESVPATVCRDPHSRDIRRVVRPLQQG
eukprot:6679277-Lingulodinium_polyedra.AAC.1